MYKMINGIQHVGIGVPNHETSWKWYRQNLGMDICFFSGAAEAPLMKIYTKGEVINKQASMILNLHGGCAMEVVTPLSFNASQAKNKAELGDIGIFYAGIKAPDVALAYNSFTENGISVLGPIKTSPIGRESFFITDPNGLIFKIHPGKDWFIKPTKEIKTGGVSEVCIGVSDIDTSLKFYSDILGYDEILMDETKVFDDWKYLPGGKKRCRRVLLGQQNKPKGGFAHLSGITYIELVQSVDVAPKKIYTGRIWGDIGFVHLGLDVKGMKALGEDLKAKGFGFTCDSKMP